MIIWSGWGILIVIVLVASMVGVQVGVNHVKNDPHFYQDHNCPKALGFTVAALASLPVGWLLNRKRTQEVVDPTTGERSVVHVGGGGHSLFFIPVQYWWTIFLVIAVTAFFW